MKCVATRAVWLILAGMTALSLSGCGGSEVRNNALILPLEGEWRVMRGDSLWYSFPDYNDAHWPTINLPSRNLYKAYAALNNRFPPEERNAVKGFVWLRRSFDIEELPRGKLLFQAGEIMNADEIYLNGMLIGASGRFPPQFRSGWANFRSYPVPHEVLRKGRNTIAMRIYFDSEAWVMGPIRIVDYRHGSRVKMLYDALKIYGMQILAVILFGLSVFFMFLFLRRKKEFIYLFFSLCAFAQAITIGLCFFENLYPDLSYSSDTVLRVTQAALLMVPPFMVLFYRSYCGDLIRVRELVIYLALPIAGIFLIFIVPHRSDILTVRNVSILTIFAYIGDLLYRAVRNFIRKNRSGMLMFIGLAPTIVLAVFDILAFAFGIVKTSMALYLYGVPAMIIFFAIHLVDRFVTSLERMEQLNLALQESIVENMRLAALERELDIARTIQMATLPVELPPSPYFDIAVKYIPAEKIGGDYYHFYSADNGGLGVLIADVSGHGVPAALVCSMIKVMADMLSHLASRPDMFIAEMNRRLMGIIGQQFMTGGYAFIDSTGRRLLYARAGHLPLMYQKRGRDSIDELMPHGRAIGFTHHSTYDLFERELNSGDRLVLYTDCLIEAKNLCAEMFGEERFRAILQRERARSASELSSILYSEVAQWCNGYLDDDFTVIVIDVR